MLLTYIVPNNLCFSKKSLFCKEMCVTGGGEASKLSNPKTTPEWASQKHNSQVVLCVKAFALTYYHLILETESLFYFLSDFFPLSLELKPWGKAWKTLVWVVHSPFRNKWVYCQTYFRRSESYYAAYTGWPRF